MWTSRTTTSGTTVAGELAPDAPGRDDAPGGDDAAVVGGASVVEGAEEVDVRSLPPQAVARTSISPRTEPRRRTIRSRYRWFATIGVMAEPECHKVEWTRLEIGERSWRVKLEYG